MPPLRRLLVLCVLFGAQLAIVVHAQLPPPVLPMNSWTGAASNQWNNPANWSFGHVPNNSEDAAIENGANVVAAGSITCSSLYLSSGSLRIEGDLNLFTASISPGTILTLAANSGRSFKGSMMCHGTIVWEGGDINGQLNEGHASVLAIQSGGLFIDRADAAIFRNNTTMSLFGTYWKQGGTSEIAVPLTTGGIVEATSGSASFSKLANVFGLLRVNAAAGARCAFANETDDVVYLGTSPQFSGSGEIVLDGYFVGTIGGTVSFRNRFGGSLTIPAGSAVTIDGTTESPCLVDGYISNHGTLIWRGARMDLRPRTPAPYGKLTNETDGVIESRVGTDSTIQLTLLTNKGTIHQFGPAKLSLGALDNLGPLVVKGGAIEVTDLDRNDALVQVAAGSSAHFNTIGDNGYLDGNSSFAGEGEFAFSGNIYGTLHCDARLQEQFSGALTMAAGSTLTIAEPPGSSHQLLGGLTVEGTLIWQSGSITSLPHPNYGRIDIQPTGRFDIRTDETCGNNLTLTNYGLLTKSAGTGVCTISAVLVNHGLAEVVSGTLALTGGVYQDMGTTRLAGGNLQVGSANHFSLVGGTLTGPGTITGDLRVWGGTVVLDTPPGQMLQVQGNLELNSNSALTVAASSASVDDLSRLVVTGAAKLDGTLAFNTIPGFTPVWLARFPVVAAQSVTGMFATATFPPPPENTHFETCYGSKLAEVVVVPPPYPGWLFLYFGNLTDPSIIGETADPDGDGMANLLEYALGLNPLSAGSANGPTVSIRQDPVMGMSFLRMTYSYPLSASAVELVPEISSDLRSWESGDGHISVKSDTTVDRVRTITVEGLFPVLRGQSRFFRLRANRTQ